MVTEDQAEVAIGDLERMIDAARNANQAGEDAVVTAAAAPDLLRELSELVDWLHAIQRYVEDEFAMEDMLAGPRAAIAKAKGE